jgi:hypothetical protein
MKSLKQLAVKAVLGLAAFGGALAVAAAPSEAKADPYYYHYFGPRVYVQRAYVPRVIVPRYVAPPAIQIRAYAPDFDPWTPGDTVIVRGGFHFDPPYAPVAPVVLPW